MIVPAHALPPAESRARQRAKRQRGVRAWLIVGPPTVIVSAILGNGRQNHASVIYYVIAVPVCLGVIAAFAAAGYAGSKLAAVSVTRRPRWLYGLAAVLYTVPVAILVRIAADHIAAHEGNDNSWAAMAGGILATLCASGALFMLGRAVVPGRRRRAFWLFPPLWLDQELSGLSPSPASSPRRRR
jgi:hypothetical protein